MGSEGGMAGVSQEPQCSCSGRKLPGARGGKWGFHMTRSAQLEKLVFKANDDVMMKSSLFVEGCLYVVHPSAEQKPLFYLSSNYQAIHRKLEKNNNL